MMTKTEYALLSFIKKNPLCRWTTALNAVRQDVETEFPVLHHTMLALVRQGLVLRWGKPQDDKDPMLCVVDLSRAGERRLEEETERLREDAKGASSKESDETMSRIVDTLMQLDDKELEFAHFLAQKMDRLSAQRDNGMTGIDAEVTVRFKLR